VDRSDTESPYRKSPAIEDRSLVLIIRSTPKEWLARRHAPVALVNIARLMDRRIARTDLSSFFAVIAAVMLPFPLPTKFPISAAALSN
jgi:hypothetical protein